MMAADAPMLRMSYPQAVVAGMGVSPGGGLVVIFHGGAHAHMRPSLEATALARLYARAAGPLHISPPTQALCRCSLVG